MENIVAGVGVVPIRMGIYGWLGIIQYINIFIVLCFMVYNTIILKKYIKNRSKDGKGNLSYFCIIIFNFFMILSIHAVSTMLYGPLDGYSEYIGYKNGMEIMVIQNILNIVFSIILTKQLKVKEAKNV